MTNLPPPLPAADVNYQSGMLVNRDDEHLRMLSIFWYIWAALSALFGTIPVIHLVLGLTMLLSPSSFGAGPPPPAFMGWMFTCIGASFVTLGWSGAILGLFTGLSLPRRRRLLLCQIAAGIACINIPLGTILGVFTFVVLSRPSVRSQFT